MALMTDERRKEMEEEMNRFELEIALPGDGDLVETLHGAPPPREHANLQRRKAQLPVALESSVISALPEVLRKGPPPPPPSTSSPPIPPLCSPPAPPVLEAPPQPRFIPHQVNRHPQRPSMRHNFMDMRTPMAPPPQFSHPGPMTQFPPHANHGPMMGGPPMMPRGPMHPMQHGMPMPPSVASQMINMGPNVPMPPGFHPPPSSPMPNIQRDSHFLPRAMPSQFNPPGTIASTIESSSSPVVAAAPAIYAAPFMKSQEEIVSEKSSPSNGQFQSLPVTIAPIIQRVDKPQISKPVTETIHVPIPTVSVPEEVVVSKKKEKKKKVVRMAGGQAWEDNSLQEWDPDDFRIFCGDLGNDVTDEVLIRAFSKYTSFVKAKVIRDKRTNKTKGYGFVSFKDPQDFIKAMREMNGRYVGSRPIKLRKSTWRDRNIDIVRKKQKEKEKLGLL